eukprot:2471682-Rhodomonas_salina.1
MSRSWTREQANSKGAKYMNREVIPDADDARKFEVWNSFDFVLNQLSALGAAKNAKCRIREAGDSPPICRLRCSRSRFRFLAQGHFQLLSNQRNLLSQTSLAILTCPVDVQKSIMLNRNPAVWGGKVGLRGAFPPSALFGPTVTCIAISWRDVYGVPQERLGVKIFRHEIHVPSTRNAYSAFLFRVILVSDRGEELSRTVANLL